MKSKKFISRSKRKPDNLLQWQTWLEGELTPPLSDVVRSNPELKRVLKAFLKLVIHVRQAQGVATVDSCAPATSTHPQQPCIFVQKHKTDPQL
jgi:hypothetical protein